MSVWGSGYTIVVVAVVVVVIAILVVLVVVVEVEVVVAVVVVAVEVGVSHKGGSTKEDDDLWFNKPCTCGRLATAIEDGTNTMLYMYIGGHTICQQQSNLLSNLVVSCKSWRWAALLYAAARVVTLASNNSLGPLNSNLMRPMDEDERNSTTETVCSFQKVCESMWGRVRETCNEMLYELEEALKRINLTSPARAHSAPAQASKH